MKINKIGRAAAVFALLFGLAGAAMAQPSGGTSTQISLTATMVSAVSVSCVSQAINFGTAIPIVSGYVVTASPDACTFNWNVPSGSALYAYVGFSSSTALVGTAGTITSAEFEASGTSGADSTTLAPCNGTVNSSGPVPSFITAGNACTGVQNYELMGPASGTVTDNLTFAFVEPDTGLTPGDLTGTLYVELDFD